MATVTGFTAARMLEIEQMCIVSGAVDLSGNLQLTRRDGGMINAGKVTGDEKWSDILDKPSTFPPSSHNHPIGQVNGLENRLRHDLEVDQYSQNPYFSDWTGILPLGWTGDSHSTPYYTKETTITVSGINAIRVYVPEGVGGVRSIYLGTEESPIESLSGINYILVDFDLYRISGEYSNQRVNILIYDSTGLIGIQPLYFVGNSTAGIGQWERITKVVDLSIYEFTGTSEIRVELAGYSYPQPSEYIIGRFSIRPASSFEIENFKANKTVNTIYSVTSDWDLALLNNVVYYSGGTALNTPTEITPDLWFGSTENLLDTYIQQTVVAIFDATSTDTQTFRRYKQLDWTPWYRIRLSQSELDSRYAQLVHTHTANQITDFDSASISAMPAATVSIQGKVELATNAETQAGTDSTRAVTPQSLSSRTATTGRTGIAELATNAEVQNGSDSSRIVTPAGLSSRTATETRTGLVHVASMNDIWNATDELAVLTATNQHWFAQEYVPQVGRKGTAYKTTSWTYYSTSRLGFYWSEGNAEEVPVSNSSIRYYGKTEILGEWTSGNYDGPGILGVIQTVTAWNPTTNAIGLTYRRAMIFNSGMGSYGPWIEETATDSTPGTVELATNAETQSGSDSTRAVTPAGLASLTSTTSRRGLVELATPAEALTGTDTARAVTPKGLKDVADTKAPLSHTHTASQVTDFDSAAVSAIPTATQTVQGKVELATNAEVQAGSDSGRAVTPAGLNSRTATTGRTGLVELATNAETQAGTDSTRAVTPAGLSSLVALTTQPGLVQLSTIAQAIAGTREDLAVTPAGLSEALAEASQALPLPNRLAENVEMRDGADWNTLIFSGFYFAIDSVNEPKTSENGFFGRVVSSTSTENPFSVISQELVEMYSGDGISWRRFGMVFGETPSFSAWEQVGNTDTGTVDLSSHIESGFTGSIEGRIVGKTVEIVGSVSGTFANNSVANVINSNPLPASWRPEGSNRWGAAYNANHSLTVVVRPAGTMGIGNRTGGTLTSPQFSITYLIP